MNLLADQPERPRERADAARNRVRVLEAAAVLFASRDPRTVTMDDVAKAAGVGRGTLYRRFPDVASIARALLDEHERELQEKLLRGEPPLGPGAPPAERLAAFYAAMVELLDAHIALVLGAETGPRRFETGAYGFWRAHVRALAAEHAASSASAPASGAGPGPRGPGDGEKGATPGEGGADVDVLADVLLAPLASELFERLRAGGRTTDEITATLTALAFRALR
ncbi:TetR/AcrR family transcriptional regulator [Actinomadura harenae]|uniref:TetR/AcrR family transcriptional regulator n=1 Tax=Actinomadura harenae TaxID=2483351 RepID=A0A3M2LTM0_9ACTN|nr:TetR/AcrR family transcriptional regulator [Actinomadura harenae]RMI40210.1 TetR/AcrR family transcriptional regulator [Actinomadura harenae]